MDELIDSEQDPQVYSKPVVNPILVDSQIET
jgi:hypothetical protein